MCKTADPLRGDGASPDVHPDTVAQLFHQDCSLLVQMLLMVQTPEEVKMPHCVLMCCICAVCLTSVSSPPLPGTVWPLSSSCSGDVCWSRSSSWSSSSRAGAHSATLARWVQLSSINCGNATQPLAALCRDNQIITYTLSQREVCLSGRCHCCRRRRAGEDGPVRGVSGTFCQIVLYYRYCFSIYVPGTEPRSSQWSHSLM